MTAQLMIPQDAITFHGNELRTTSLKVAEAFGKLHKNIIQKIESLDCSPEFTSANFSAHVQEVAVGNGAKRPSKVYEMTKDGFMFLVMGFTGKKAAAIKEAYINAFNLMHDHLFGSGQQPAKPNPQPDTIDANEQAMLLGVMNHRAAEELPELQQVVKNILTGKFEQTFGCTLDQLPKDKHSEAIRLILNAPLEGEVLPAGTTGYSGNPELDAELQQIGQAVGRYYFKDYGNSFMDGQQILDELHQYLPRDVHGLLKQLNRVLVTGYTHADEAITRLKTTAAMLDNWRGPKQQYGDYLTRRL